MTKNATKYVTSELLDSFVHLVERIIAEVELITALPVEEREKREQLLVPTYLCAKGQLNSRTYLVRALRQFTVLLSSKKSIKFLLGEEGATKEPLTIEQLELALVDILYAEHLRRPLFEYLAAERLQERIREDARKHFTQELMPTTQETINKINILLRNHKIATLVIGGRLPKGRFEGIWKKLKDKDIDSRVLGLQAAAYYDTPYDHTDTTRNEKAIEIFSRWASGKYSPDDLTSQIYTKLAGFVILYDLPICNVKQDGCRTNFAEDYLGNFCEFAIQQLSQNGLAIKEVANNADKYFLTFIYDQGRRYAFDLENPGQYGKNDGIIRLDFKKGVEQLQKRYEIVERTDVPKGVRLFEFRFKREYAYALALGASETDLDKIAEEIAEEIKKDDNWPEIVYKLATGKLKGILDDPSICMAPLKNYLSLAHFMQLCEIARIYERQPDDASLSIEISGSFDNSFPSRLRGFFPNPVVTNDKLKASISATEKKALATHAVNAGICAGFSSLRIYENKSSGWGKELINSVLELMKNPKAGFDLLLYYIEQYDRAFDLTLSGEKVQKETISSYQRNIINDSEKLKTQMNEVDVDWCSIGIDIGGTAIKFGLYDSNFKSQGSFRLSTQKDIENESVKYESLANFAERLKEGIEHLIFQNGRNWEDIKVIGISWPGAIRDGKIAATSGIFKYFEPSVASNLIRKNTVNDIRKLDLTAEVEKKLKNLNPNITVALCNDGFAEALGRVLDTKEYRRRTWAILKLGTGTAGAVISDHYLRGGMLEFGKLVNNIFCRDESSLTPEEGDRKIFDATVNKIASANLLPNVFCEQAHSTAKFSSYEIGRVAQFFFEHQNCQLLSKDINKLILDIGIDRLYREHFAHIMSKDEFENLKKAGYKDAYKLKRSVLSKLKLRKFDEVEALCKDQGAERIVDMLFEIISASSKANTVLFDGDLVQDTYVDFLQKFLTNPNDCNIILEFFDKLFNCAGALLADVLALIRLYYKLDGVIFSGGVLANTSSSSKLIASVERHLRAKYGIHLGTLDEYQTDDKKGLVGKRSFTTLYSNLNKVDKAPKKIWEVKTDDKGEIGCLHNAAIKRIMSR